MDPVSAWLPGLIQRSVHIRNIDAGVARTPASSRPGNVLDGQ